MDRYIIAFIVGLALACNSASAQRARRGGNAARQTVPPVEQARAAIADYRFEEAEGILTSEITALKRKRKPTTEAELLLEQARVGRQKLSATERIVVIDSVVVGRNEAMQAIALSRENGRIGLYATTYHVADSLGCTLYENDLGNRRIVAVPASDGVTLLAVSDLIGNSWTAPTPLAGLNESLRQNFPFVLADGMTLYYAATGDESMGGYDIFVTRVDASDAECLTPENVGFPFNSTANDYLLCIDEQSQLGWFVSDRQQPADSVCVYTFIPNDMRQTYGDDISEAELRSVAKLTSIRQTWNVDNSQLEAARVRLAHMRSGAAGGEAEAQQQADFHFVISDTREYTRYSDFQSQSAREMMHEWVQLDKELSTDGLMLNRLRDNYAAARPADRQQLATTIRQLEATYYLRLEQLRALTKAIRRAEAQ